MTRKVSFPHLWPLSDVRVLTYIFYYVRPHNRKISTQTILQHLLKGKAARKNRTLPYGEGGSSMYCIISINSEIRALEEAKNDLYD